MDNSRLRAQLLNTGLQNKDNPLFQYLDQLNTGVDSNAKQIGIINSAITNITNTINNITQIMQTNILGGDDSSSFNTDNIIGIPGPIGLSGRDGISIPSIDGIDGVDSFIPGPKGIDGLNSFIASVLDSGSSDQGESLFVPPAYIGTGTPGKLAKWSTATILTDSLITESGNTLTTPAVFLINGSSGAGNSFPSLNITGNIAAATGVYTASGLVQINTTINNTLSTKADLGLLVNTTFIGSGSGYVAATRMQTTDNTNVANQLYSLDVELDTSGSGAKSIWGINSGVSNGITVATTAYGINGVCNASGAFTTGTRVTYGINGSTSVNGNNGGTDNNYAGYFEASGVVTSGIINNYGVYIGNGVYNTTGTSTAIGLFIETITGADTNYSAIFQGGNVGIGTTTPTVALDIVGSERITGPTLRLIDASANFTVEGTSIIMTIQPGFLGTSSASPNGGFVILIGNATAGKMHNSKGFSWGDTTDPGASNFRVAGTSRLVGSITADTGVGSYKGVNTTGMGVIPIYGYISNIGLTGTATQNVMTTASDCTIIVLVNIFVTISTTYSFNIRVNYTDIGGTARTVVLSFIKVDGGAGGAITQTISNPDGTIPYAGIPIVIRAKNATAITVSSLGTFTSVTYNFETTIAQAA